MLPNMVWMEIDPYNKELPLHVADSAEELAALCGVKRSTVESSASRSKREPGRHRFMKVWIGGD